VSPRGEPAPDRERGAFRPRRRVKRRTEAGRLLPDGVSDAAHVGDESPHARGVEAWERGALPPGPSLPRARP
jgi:hypothetical protein